MPSVTVFKHFADMFVSMEYFPVSTTNFTWPRFDAFLNTMYSTVVIMCENHENPGMSSMRIFWKFYSNVHP
jgi:hypothetical protein